MNVSDTKLDILIDKLEAQAEHIKEMRSEVTELRATIKRSTKRLEAIQNVTNGRLTNALSKLHQITGGTKNE